MTNISIWRRPGVWILAIVIGTPVYFLYRVVDGVVTEGERAGRYAVFATAGERAIQLSRFGRTFAIKGDFAVKGDYKIPRIPRDVVNDPSIINCAIKLNTYFLDQTENPSVYILLDASNPRVVYLIYHGRPPDFSPVLSNPDGRKYFGPHEYYYSGAAAMKFDINDQSYHYDAYIKGRDFSWQSYECTTYSYTIINEN